MQSRHFDAIARALASPTTRRGAVRRLGLGGLAAALTGRALLTPASVDAHHCDYIGCGCATGTRHPCAGGLVCCPINPGMPGSAGVCSNPGDCGDVCAADGNSCGGSCNWGDVCPACCSGYCGDLGRCGHQTCGDPGCACATGTSHPCNAGLVCCSSYPGLPGAQGTCQYSC